MFVKIKLYLLVLAVLLVGFGCNGDKDKVASKEIEDAKKLAQSLGENYRSKLSTTSYSKSSLDKSEGFSLDSSYNGQLDTPMIIDIDGNLQKGGIFKFINEENNQVVIEVTDTNIFTIRVDLNGDGEFSANEVVVEKFDTEFFSGGGSGGGYSDINPIKPDDIMGDSLKKLLDLGVGENGYIGDDEKIGVEILLLTYEPIFQSKSHSENVSNVFMGSDGYFYNGKEVSKEFMDEIDEKRRQEMNRQSEIRAKYNKEALNAFLDKNSLQRTDAINKALENGRDNFIVELTKSEIKKIYADNKKTILYIGLETKVSISAIIHNTFENSIWNLVSYGYKDELKILKNHKSSIYFNSEEKVVKGDFTCNGFGASYLIDGEKFSLSEMTSTEMYCGEELANIDDFISGVLSSLERFELVDDTLVLYSSKSGILVYN